MTRERYQKRLERCGQLMTAAGLDVLVLTKPANMAYLTGDGRLCAYAMIVPDGRVALGVPVRRPSHRATTGAVRDRPEPGK